MSPIDKELSFLFLSISFINLYRMHNKKANCEKSKDLMDDLYKRSLKYKKKVKKVTDKAIDLFDNCKEDLEKEKQRRANKKFFTKAHFEDDGDLYGHPLLFATALILEHKELKNKKLFLPYAKAQQIYNDFEGINEPNIKNSRVLAKFFADKLNNL